MSTVRAVDGIRASYDTVAGTYAATFGAELDGKPLDRALLAAFAETVTRPVLDVGCGPGHVTAHLCGLGLDVTGLDLSPGMVEQARRTYPRGRYAVGDMTALQQDSGTVGGIVAFYSTIHLPDDVLPIALAEFARVLRPGGSVLLAFQAGAGERLHQTDWHGHEVDLDHYRRDPEAVAALLTAAGLDVRMRLLRSPEPTESAPRAYLRATAP
jgi:SAM-dependent methyltransferase